MVGCVHRRWQVLRHWPSYQGTRYLSRLGTLLSSWTVEERARERQATLMNRTDHVRHFAFVLLFFSLAAAGGADPRTLPCLTLAEDAVLSDAYDSSQSRTAMRRGGLCRTTHPGASVDRAFLPTHYGPLRPKRPQIINNPLLRI